MHTFVLLFLLNAYYEGTELTGYKESGVHEPNDLPKDLSFLILSFIVGSAFFATDYKQRISGWASVEVVWDRRLKTCQTQKRPQGTETLPKGIVSPMSDMEMRSLWSDDKKVHNLISPATIRVSISSEQTGFCPAPEPWLLSAVKPTHA
ncbi:unnamed protein product [Dovyalis caffra]|uniref:Uncharacterized protein n=1 Tax=Dovyalis caffra TaxID=77055 RepID=A0AAV1SCR0_9ROSI|nr:unnamed protein product [Dovyalis caffra]